SKKCSKCGISKPVDQYGRNAHCAGGLQPHCKSCQSLITKKYNNTRTGFLKALIYHSKTAVQRRTGRNLTSTLTEDKINTLIKAQHGKCAISGAVLVFKSFSDNQASVDRIKDNLGYIDGNCRLVCLEFNTAVKWSP
ncbi:unnamed protein product, partial [Phaeothamnion confervicola]